jgi:hypothetical protein
LQKCGFSDRKLAGPALMLPPWNQSICWARLAFATVSPSVPRIRKASPRSAGAAVLKYSRQHRQVFGMGVGDQAQRRPSKGCRIFTRVCVELRTPRMRRSDSWWASLGARVSIGMKQGRPAAKASSMSAVEPLGAHAHLGQDLGRGHASRILLHAVDQHRHAFARQQQGQQRRQVGQLARAVVAGDEHRRDTPGGAAAARTSCFRGVHEAGDLVHRFALDAHGQQDAAQFEVGHAPVQHGAVEFAGVRRATCCARLSRRGRSP